MSNQKFNYNSKVSLSVPLLHIAIANNPVKEIFIAELRGDLSLRPGGKYSELKIARADPTWPVVIDKNMHVLDGRHRIEKIRRSGKEKVRVQVATEEQIKFALV